MALHAGASEKEREQYWQARLGYGFGAFSERFVSTSGLAIGWSEDVRDYSLGWNLRQDYSDTFDVMLEATHRYTAEGQPQQGIGVRMKSYW